MELSEPTVPIAERLENRRAIESATITAVRFEPNVYEATSGDFRELTAEELASVAFPDREIVLRGCGSATRHDAPNGTHFTVRDLIAAIEESERRTRGESAWFGGVDVHHVFFEGLSLADDGVWNVDWGS